MSEKLEPVSNAFGSLLDSLGIPKDNWQSHMLAYKTKKRLGTKSKDALRKEYYDSAGRIETIASIAARIQAKPAIVWRPLAYVMFIRTSHCQNCLSDSFCMDCPQIYLMESDNAASTTRRYTPVSSIEYPALPHYTKDTRCETQFCTECFVGNSVPNTEVQIAVAPNEETPECRPTP